VSYDKRDKNNRELLWVRCTLVDATRQHGEGSDAALWSLAPVPGVAQNLSNSIPCESILDSEFPNTSPGLAADSWKITTGPHLSTNRTDTFNHTSNTFRPFDYPVHITNEHTTSAFAASSTTERTRITSSGPQLINGAVMPLPGESSVSKWPSISS
jgi:hypothetical protein